MGMGRRRREVRQGELWVAVDRLASTPRHIFYDKLNGLLDAAGFDRFCEDLCEPFYTGEGRPSIPPGRYFRMLLVGYFEGIDSQRGIAWRCSDSLSLRKFLFLQLHEESPDHSSLSRIRDRLPLEVHEQVFEFVLQVARDKKLLKDGQLSVGIDATTLEANAAMKAIVRKETGEDWKAYIKRLMQEAGLIDEDDDDPSDEDLRRFDKQRKGKKVSNEEWASPVDPDAKIIRMKDGRTHLGYKAEHVVDLDSELLLGVEIYEGTAGDAQTLLESLTQAQRHLEHTETEPVTEKTAIMATPADTATIATIAMATDRTTIATKAIITEVAADKGYHALQTLTDCQEAGVRTYIPERQSTAKDGRRYWQDKYHEDEQAFRANRRRVRRQKGRRLQRQRSERVERSFAHVCDTGGARRTWLRGLEKIKKRYLLTAAGRNLSLLMRHLFGIGKPRGLQDAMAAVIEALRADLCALLAAIWHLGHARDDAKKIPPAKISTKPTWLRCQIRMKKVMAIWVCSTGC